MQYKFATLVAVGLAAMQAVAYSHGEQGEFDGKAIKWQQLAQGVFTGVPAKDWNDKSEFYPISNGLSTDTPKVHKQGFQELDIEELISLDRNISGSQGDNLELAERNIPDQCRAAVNCAKVLSQGLLALGKDGFFKAVEAVSNGAVMDFLNQPFVANAAGVAVAGVISGQINEATKKQCTSSGNEVDALKDAAEIALRERPGSDSISVTITTPAGPWTLDLTAKPEGESPSPKCTDN
ncbi:hypothetical protein FHETE_3787 [Fusarium heterosporum]|uniref:Uncharacterized protein n=1 Tax=Fusarium heterosporum TaxID=42747 RepID=A0A8H5WW76_FUSHE|nr:hypothetical protein FHETE_3787 [Fusarium heterosporum]